MMRCIGNQILVYDGLGEDLTTGIYIEFMIRPSSLSSGSNTIVAFQTNHIGGYPFSFFRVAYSPSSSYFQLYVEVYDAESVYRKLSNPNLLTASKMFP